MKTSEFIAEAAETIKKDGWTQGAYGRQNGSLCTVQALKRVSMNHLTDGGIQLFEPAKKLVQKKFAEILGWSEDTSIPHMNDHSDTTELDVLTALEKAMIEAEEHGD